MQRMNTVYDNPEYYEIAFSFRDIRAEVDVFERCIELFAQRQEPLSEVAPPRTIERPIVLLRRKG
jgi:hypothetical protein